MKRWTEPEVAELRRLKPTMTNRELAEIFGTTPGAIAQKCFDLGIKRGCQPNAIRLTGQQERWLTQNFPHMANVICALILGISQRSVVRQARRRNAVENVMVLCSACHHELQKRPHYHGIQHLESDTRWDDSEPLPVTEEECIQAYKAQSE